MSATTATHLVSAPVAGQVYVKPGRIVSADILRGLTIALMILVNTPGDGRVAYHQLDHIPWNGWTITDMVFPTFLFLVGCSIVFALQGRLERGESKGALARKIVRRAALIFAIDLFLSAMPKFQYTHLRIYGVLTRIAIVYLVVALTFLYVRRIRPLLAITAVCLVGYWILMRYVPTPGLGHPTIDFPILDPDKNLGAWLDRHIIGFLQRTIHTGHLYDHGTRDPEGLLSTIPSFGTAFLGCCAALWMRRPNMTLVKNRLYLLGFGVLGIVLGELWNPYLPINKKVWTSSYVLFCAGIASILLASLSMLVDTTAWKDRPRWMHAGAWPWLVFGSNAIFAYAIADVWEMIFNFWHFSDPARPNRSYGLFHWGYIHTIAAHGSTANASLVYSICFVGLCFFSTWLLWRKQIFLRV